MYHVMKNIQESDKRLILGALLHWRRSYVK